MEEAKMTSEEIMNRLVEYFTNHQEVTLITSTGTKVFMKASSWSMFEREEVTGINADGENVSVPKDQIVRVI